eukprot:767566-Hanusia_phi.AAC.8
MSVSPTASRRRSAAVCGCVKGCRRRRDEPLGVNLEEDARHVSREASEALEVGRGAIARGHSLSDQRLAGQRERHALQERLLLFRERRLLPRQTPAALAPPHLPREPPSKDDSKRSAVEQVPERDTEDGGGDALASSREGAMTWRCLTCPSVS